MCSLGAKTVAGLNLMQMPNPNTPSDRAECPTLLGLFEPSDVSEVTDPPQAAGRRDAVSGGPSPRCPRTISPDGTARPHSSDDYPSSCVECYICI